LNNSNTSIVDIRSFEGKSLSFEKYLDSNAFNVNPISAISNPNYFFDLIKHKL
jgi:hypothetical protein